MDKVILRTQGFMRSIPPEKQNRIMSIAVSKINPKTNWVVFKKEAEKEHFEDEGRTLVVPMDIPKTVYAILDDYGDSGTLSDNLGQKVNTRYAVTFLLAEEY